MHAATVSLVGDFIVPGEEVVVDLAANYKAWYHGAIAHLLERLEDGRAFESALEDNLETLPIVESAYRTGGSPGPELPTTST